jgi:protoporphyrinogen oxidase
MAEKVVIVGAGVAGLTLAKKLTAQNIDTVVIEREGAVGGLARSFNYASGATFDIGPHRFHTDDPEVQRFIEETLGDNLIIIDRNSQLFLFDRYVPWPIALQNIIALPPTMLLRMALDMVWPKKAKSESFEDYIIEKYGKTLYKVFFKPYTEKFLNYTCANLHKDWASAGINRATIDKQVKTSSLMDLVKSVLFSKNPDTKFIYPRTGGIGIFPEKLASEVKNQDGRVILSSQISEFITKGRKISSVVTDSGEEIKADFVFWSGSLGSLCKTGKAPGSVPRMSYISTIVFNYLVSGRIEQDFQWCYFGDGKMEMNRATIPRNFNPNLVPPGKDSMCIEMVSSENSEVWNDPSRLDCVIETFLLRTGLLKSLDCVDEYHVEGIRETYPMYTLNYHRKLRGMFRWVSETWDNLTLLGRTGRFWYNNMDHSIAASLKVAELFVEDYRKGVLRDGDAYSIEDRLLGG